MIYNGALKYNEQNIYCNPCLVKGIYFKKDDVLVVSEGIVVFKFYEYLVIYDGVRFMKTKITDLYDIYEQKKESTVTRL